MAENQRHADVGALRATVVDMVDEAARKMNTGRLSFGFIEAILLAALAPEGVTAVDCSTFKVRLWIGAEPIDVTIAGIDDRVFGVTRYDKGEPVEVRPPNPPASESIRSRVSNAIEALPDSVIRSARRHRDEG